MTNCIRCDDICHPSVYLCRGHIEQLGSHALLAAGRAIDLEAKLTKDGAAVYDIDKITGGDSAGIDLGALDKHAEIMEILRDVATYAIVKLGLQRVADKPFDLAKVIAARSVRISQTVLVSDYSRELEYAALDTRFALDHTKTTDPWPLVSCDGTALQCTDCDQTLWYYATNGVSLIGCGQADHATPALKWMRVYGKDSRNA